MRRIAEEREIEYEPEDGPGGCFHRHAVCRQPGSGMCLPEPREDRWMQEVAREMTIQASMTHQTSLNGERIAHARFSAPHL